MPTLSKHTALLNFDPLNTLSPSVEPISCSVTVNETWSPYVTASVVVPTSSVPATVDPRNATYLGLRLQQDFGDLIYNKELTSSYGGSVAAITAQYSELLATNYIKNPSFTVATTDWVASGSTISRDTATYYSGVASLKVVCTGTSSNQGTYKSNSAVSGLATGQKFSSSAYVNAPVGATMEIVTASTGSGASSVTTTFTGTGAWQLVKAESATLGASLNPYVVIRTRSTAQAITFYVDNVILNMDATVEDYFDGDTTSTPEIIYEWTGTANNSASIKYDPIHPVEITRDFTKPWNIFEAALPLSTVTTSYAPVTPLKLTNANLATVWRMSDFLHSTGTFNPAPSTVFDGYLMLRSIEKNYLTGESTLELTSHEAILQEAVGYTTSVIFTSSSLKAIVNYVLNTAIGIFVNVEAGAADYTYSTPYGLKWAPNQTGWDVLNALVTAADRVLYCDEAGKWYLKNASSVSGSLALKDTDNITTLTSSINRNNPNFFDYAIVEYRNTTTGVSTYDNFGTSGFNISKDRYFLLENVDYPGAGAAQSMVWRAITRGELYKVEAISNYDARPRQTMTIDITGEPLKTATIQSVTWSLPSARMSVDIRDLV